MGQRILILGESGTGKSTSLRNFKADEIKLIKVVSKNLPFRGKFDETVTTDNANKIIQEMTNTDKKVIVIDDAQYVMSDEYFRRSKESGWDKFSDIAANFSKVLMAVDTLPEDTFVYFLSHIQRDENGIEKMKTIGRVLDEKLTIEGLCTIVLKTSVNEGVYSFQTQNSGYDTCKSPIGMFENYLIDNDLKMVDSIIREYWGYSDRKVKEVANAENGPSLRSPNPILVQGAKSHILKEAPVIQSAKPEAIKSEPPVNNAPAPSNVEDEEIVEEVDTSTATPEQAKPFANSINNAVVEENNFEEVKKEEVKQEAPAKPQEELTNQEKMARLMAKLGKH